MIRHAHRRTTPRVRTGFVLSADVSACVTKLHHRQATLLCKRESCYPDIRCLLRYEIRGQPGSPHARSFMRGLVTQLTTFDHAAGLESYRLTSHYITSYLSDAGFTGCTSPPLALTSAQIHRTLEPLVARRIIGKVSPALSGCCGSGILTADEYAPDLSGCVAW